MAIISKSWMDKAARYIVSNTTAALNSPTAPENSPAAHKI